MRGTIFILLLTIISFYAQAQNIARDSILKPGFYKTIDELIDNNPSVPFNYDITNYKFKLTFFSKEKAILYNIDIPEETVDSIKSIFGFSDGKDTYLITIRTGLAATLKGRKFSSKSNYIKIKEKGVYSYYKDFYLAHGYNGPTFDFDEHIINSKTKEIRLLSVKEMKKLLADEPDLLDEFNKDKDRKKNFEKYIIKYNNRYKAKLELNKQLLTNIFQRKKYKIEMARLLL